MRVSILNYTVGVYISIFVNEVHTFIPNVWKQGIPGYFNNIDSAQLFIEDFLEN